MGFINSMETPHESIYRNLTVIQVSVVQVSDHLWYWKSLPLLLMVRCLANVWVRV